MRNMNVFVLLMLFVVFCLACGGGKSDNDTKSCPDSLPAPSVVFAKRRGYQLGNGIGSQRA